MKTWLQIKCLVIVICYCSCVFVLFIFCLYVCVCECLLQNTNHQTKHKNNTNCGSAFEPGASGLPYYCASIWARSCCNWCASSVDSNPKKKKTSWHLGSLTAANWVSFDFNVSYSSCWNYSLINTLKLQKKHYTVFPVVH